MGAPAEARYYGYDSLLDDEKIPVKGQFLKADSLIQNPKWNNVFKEGPLLLARLCPVDYHRFHFPDNGSILDNFRVEGSYHSVNPVALKSKGDIFITNERHITILQTENFGKLAYIEVGAICVGKIIQSKRLDNNSIFKKGAEKGYFLFGGSTVIVVGEKGLWKPSEDILKNTKLGIETYVQLGMSVATNGK
jgi:phosphatidylserine decarboxylase